MPQQVFRHEGRWLQTAARLPGQRIVSASPRSARAVATLVTLAHHHSARHTCVQLEEEDTFEDFVNRDSWHETAALGDANMRALQRGDVIQLERKGFFRVDEALTRPGKSLLLFHVPDGHSKGKKGL